MIVTTKELFQLAYGKYAVGAYNINNLEQTVGLFRGNLGQKNSNDEPVDPRRSAPFSYRGEPAGTRTSGFWRP